MPKYVIKRVLWFLLLLIALGGFWELFVGVDALTLYYQQASDPGSALNIVPNVPPDLDVQLNWLHDDADTGRVLEPATRTDVQSAYLRAWLQWNISLLKNKPYGLETYFVGPALSDISTSINAIAAKAYLIEQADLTHTLQLHFYSADGSIISFTDSNATVANIVHSKSGAVIYVGETTAVYQVVMLLEDGNWRVRHWVQEKNQNLDSLITSSPPPKGFVAKSSASPTLTLNKQPYQIAGINYYPKDTAWNLFWTRYNPTIIDHDFGTILALRLNTIRIFLPFDQFGGAQLGATAGLQATATATAKNKDALVQQPLEKLNNLLTHAKQHHLHVIVTLFDFRSDYTLLHWPAADRQLETLLTRFKNNPTILAWDLKNEPDHDYRAAGQYLVNAWLTHIAYFARFYDPHHLLTIGWATPQAGQVHIPLVDFVSFHYYGPAKDLPAAYTALRVAQPHLPLVLGEFGLSTWNSPFFPNGHTEAEQAAYYAATLRALRKTDSAGYLAWTLYDFKSVPSNVAGVFPWQTGPQKAMGVFNGSGKPKRAAQLLAPDANLNVPALPWWQQFVKPFWLVVPGVSVLAIIMIAYIVRRTFVRRKRALERK